MYYRVKLNIYTFDYYFFKIYGFHSLPKGYLQYLNVYKVLTILFLFQHSVKVIYHIVPVSLSSVSLENQRSIIFGLI